MYADVVTVGLWGSPATIAAFQPGELHSVEWKKQKMKIKSDKKHFFLSAVTYVLEHENTLWSAISINKLAPINKQKLKQNPQLNYINKMT